MLFRECRVKVFEEIFSVIEPNISIEKIFLLLGGISTGMYVYYQDKFPFFIPSGCAKIHYPKVLEDFHISYEKIRMNEIVNNINFGENIYVILFNDLLLHTNEVDERRMNMFGDSQMTIKRIDKQKKHIILNHENEDKYWIDISLFNNIIGNNQYSSANNLCIYRISKKDLKNNEYLLKAIEVDNKELLKKNCQSFFGNYVEKCKDNLIRIDGKESYTYLLRQLGNLQDTYLKYKGQQEKLLLEKYIRLMVEQHKKFITVGSETNYRGEFVEILKKVEGQIFVSEEISMWEKIQMQWIQLTLKLTKEIVDFCSESVEICLMELIGFYKKISQYEFDAIKKLDNKLKLL